MLTRLTTLSPISQDSAQPTEISRSSGVDPSTPEGVNNATTHVLQSSTPINADDTSATTPRGVKRDRSEQSPHEDKDSVDAVYVSKRPKTIVRLDCFAVINLVFV